MWPHQRDEQIKRPSDSPPLVYLWGPDVRFSFKRGKRYAQLSSSDLGEVPPITDPSLGSSLSCKVV